MSETVILWMFGIVISGIGAWLSAITLWLFKVHNTQERMLTIFILQSKQAAKVLHDHGDQHGIDELLEKYEKMLDGLLNNYKTHHHDLTMAEWDRLFSACEEIINNAALPKGERLAAIAVLQGKFLRELSIHKMANKPNFQI